MQRWIERWIWNLFGFRSIDLSISSTAGGRNTGDRYNVLGSLRHLATICIYFSSVGYGVGACMWAVSSSSSSSWWHVLVSFTHGLAVSLLKPWQGLLMNVGKSFQVILFEILVLFIRHHCYMVLKVSTLLLIDPGYFKVAHRSCLKQTKFLEMSVPTMDFFVASNWIYQKVEWLKSMVLAGGIPLYSSLLLDEYKWAERSPHLFSVSSWC